MRLEKEKLCVIGCGLMGGSLLMSLEGKGYEIWAVDIDEHVLGEIQKQELAQHVSTEPAKAIAWADIIVPCLMPQTVIELMAEHGRAIKPGAILTDFCGVKSPILQAARQYLPSCVAYVGAHPMAGLEKGKFVNATPMLFNRANALLIPAPEAEDTAVDTVFCLLKRTGCVRITRCTPERHDEMIGFTSQMMHLLAAGIANHPLYPHSKGYEGGSLRDFTRIATIDAEMWSALCMLNREFLTPVLKDYVKNLESVLQTLEQEDTDGLKTMLQSANAVKEQWIHAPTKSTH